MKNPTCHKEVHNLNGILVVVSRFLAKSGDKSFPFFDVLRDNKKFEWTLGCEEAFQDLKKHLRTLPPLAKPAKGDALFLYDNISLVAVSSILVKNLDQGQVSVYYVSKFLSKTEINYMDVEKYL